MISCHIVATVLQKLTCMLVFFLQCAHPGNVKKGVRDATCDDVSMTCADMKGKCHRTTRDESLG